MKQAFLLHGKVVIQNIPIPRLSAGLVLVKTKYSCISAGTEISAVNNTKQSLLKRAITKPALVFRTLRIAKSRGLSVMINNIRSSTGSGYGLPIGYSAAGTVISSKAQHNIYVHDQNVAIVGTLYANHAQYNTVPENLVIPVPQNVSLQDASTAALGGIAMQGVNQLSPKPGEYIVVMGLGLIGQLTVQILLAASCRVIGVDVNEERLLTAKEHYGIQVFNGNDQMLLENVFITTHGNGADGVLFTASTSSDAPMSTCFKMLRKKGRFILVGVSGMNINRDDIYQKELDFKIASSYGPGRYDPDYEEKGIDYPYEYVKLTEKRNIETYFDMLSNGSISLCHLSNQIYNIGNANKAYERLQMQNPPLLSLIEYSSELDEVDANNSRVTLDSHKTRKAKTVSVGLIGAGNYAKSIQLPNMDSMKSKYYIKAIMNRSAAPAAALATQFGAEYYTVDATDILNDKDVDLVMICTRHDSHSRYAISALNAGKFVFVEKPPALNWEELTELLDAISNHPGKYFVGYNRRYSKYALEIKKKILQRCCPVHIEYTMNAGYIPFDSWVHGDSGGGRIIGEGCHIIDLFQYLVGSSVKSLISMPVVQSNEYYHSDDNVSCLVNFCDGSTAFMSYISIGAKTMPKETMHLTCGDIEFFLDDYRELTASGTRCKRLFSAEPDKGQRNILYAIYDTINGKCDSTIPASEIKTTSEITFAIADSVKDLEKGNIVF